MPNDDGSQEILQRLTRVETKLDMMLNARDIAQEALQSTKVAHKRLDSMEKYEEISTKAFDNSLNAHARLDKIDKWIFWFGTTLIGAIILAAVAFVVRGGLNLK